VNDKIEALKQANQGEDAEAISRSADELSQALQKIGSSLYNKKDDRGPDESSAG